MHNVTALYEGRSEIFRHGLLFRQTVNCKMAYFIYIDQLDAQIVVISLYFPLHALHVSNYISPSSEARFGAVHRNWYMPTYERRSRSKVS